MINLVISIHGEDLVEVKVPMVPNVGEMILIGDGYYEVVKRDYTINLETRAFHASIDLE